MVWEEATMRSKAVWIILSLLCIGVLPSCSSEEDPVEPAGGFRDLTARDDVINNLELGYRSENIGEIDRALDLQFQFCYTVNFRTTCWLRDDDLSITQKLFEPSVIEDGKPPVTAVDIEFSYAGGDNRWLPSTPPNRDKYPGDVLWEKTATYNINITRDDEIIEWASPGRATFIIHTVHFDGKNRWRIIGIVDHSGHWGQLKQAFQSAE